MKKVKGILRREAPDLVEPLLDEAAGKLANQLFHHAMPELAKDLPVIKYIKTGSDMYSTYKLMSLHKKMRAFLQSLLDGRFDITVYESLKSEEKATMIDILVTELDNQTDKLQSEALGLLFVAYIQKKIDRLTFLGIAHELKNTNPLLFYFNVDSIGVTEKYKDKDLALYGPVHYLPSSFYSNGTDRLQLSSDGPFLTSLGRAFYENVYVPMSGRYTT
jgi:hypothetical protein